MFSNLLSNLIGEPAWLIRLQTIGRNGMHRFYIMDRSMLPGILTTENILGANHDLWDINEMKEYLE